MSLTELKLFWLSSDLVEVLLRLDGVQVGLRLDTVEVGLRRVSGSNDSNGRLFLRLKHFFRFLFGKSCWSLSD